MKAAKRFRSLRKFVANSSSDKSDILSESTGSLATIDKIKRLPTKSNVKLTLLQIKNVPSEINDVIIYFGFNGYTYQTDLVGIRENLSHSDLNYEAEFSIKTHGNFKFKIKTKKGKTIGYSLLDILEVTDDDSQVHSLPFFKKKEYASQFSKALPLPIDAQLPIVLTLKASGIINFFKMNNHKSKTIKHSRSISNLNSTFPSFNWTDDSNEMAMTNSYLKKNTNSPSGNESITENIPKNVPPSPFNTNTMHVEGKNNINLSQKNDNDINNLCLDHDDEELIKKRLEQDCHTNGTGNKDHVFQGSLWNGKINSNVGSVSNLASISQFGNETQSSNMCRSCEEIYFNKILKYQKIIKDLKNENLKLEQEMTDLTVKLVDIGNQIFEEENLFIKYQSNDKT